MSDLEKQIIVAAGCLLIALGGVASGQGYFAEWIAGSVAAGAAEAAARAKEQAGARSRVGEARPSGANKGTPAQGQNQTQGQTNAGNRKGGKANANINASPNANTSYAAALQRCVRERHDRNWWRQRYTVIVLVGRGYYYWDSGYWYPAFGYDPVYDYYDYDGPIFTYGNLLPDQVIINVQRALKELGYYTGGLTGSIGPATRQALANYQQDAGLEATGAIDAATVEALGLY